MWDGTALPHSGQVLSCGFRQRLAPRRMRCLLFEVLRLGTAMVRWASGFLILLAGRVSEGVEGPPAAVSLRSGRVLYITFCGLVHR